MKTLVVNRKIIVSIIAVMLLTYSMQSISYGQDDVSSKVVRGRSLVWVKQLVVTPGETNASLKVSFIDRFFEPNKRALPSSIGVAKTLKEIGS